MNQMKDLVGTAKKELFETAWLQAVEENRPAEEMGAALEALVAVGKTDFA